MTSGTARRLLARPARAAALLLALAAAAPAPAALDVAARRVALNPDDPAQDRVGKLRYLGGLVLSSRDPRVGGVSGMRFLADGRLMAVTDNGDQLFLTLVEDGERLSGVRGVALARLPGTDGQPLRGKADADAEALELDADGVPFVAFERRHRVMRYPAGGRPPRAVRFADEAWLSSLPSNGGIEAMARVGDVWLYLAEEPPPGFKPTDAAALDDSRVAILFRRFSPSTGVAAAIGVTRVDRERLTLGPVEIVGWFAPPLTVDNFEALAARRAAGRTFLYVASDDNFSPLQRTLLMKFELTP